MAPPTLTQRQKEAIVSSVQGNRVTVVVGPTGCGKSTLVPVALLEGLGGPIVVTQPRRLAVVAVATHVASQVSNRRTRNVTTSSTVLDTHESIVGFHVGQSNHSNKNTQLLFATAGILLGELRAQGPRFLEKYECILIDECHERSPENDLVLAMIRTFFVLNKKLKTRLVLMSATFDYKKYQEYFAELLPECRGSGKVPVVNLETAQSFSNTYENVETHYLDDGHTSQLLANVARTAINGIRAASILSAWRQAMKHDPTIDLSEADGRLLSQPLLLCIATLIQTLHTQESSNAVFLVFAPTYTHLEQIYEYVQNAWTENVGSSGLDMSVLHRSIDIEDCLRSMQQTIPSLDNGLSPRRVLLASAIADSSITIPNVTCVIDTCRSLQIKWNAERETHVTRTIWASQSICDQRKGRTGRTNPGKVYRLLPKNYFVNKLKAHETPQLTISDCQNELLQLLTSTLVTAKSSNATELLSRTLDPPPAHVVDVAASYLIELGACESKQQRNNRAVLVPTKYGRILAELPFAVKDSVSILLAGQHGLWHEMLLLKSIEATRPYPVVHYFAEEDLTKQALDQFYAQNDGEYESNRMEVSEAMVAHMSAYMYWDVEWNRGRQWTAMESFLQQTQPETSNGGDYDTADKGVWKWSAEIEDAHVQWCKKHRVNPTSVRAVTETMDLALRILYKAAFEPKWLYCSDTEPKWRLWDDVSLDNGPRSVTFRVFDKVYGNTKDVLLSQMKALSLGRSPTSARHSRSSTPRRVLCPHFLLGNCTFGVQCRYSHNLHDPTVQRPICRFFLEGRCKKGNACAFSHSTGQESHTSGTRVPIDKDPFSALVPENPATNTLLSTGLENWVMEHIEGMVLFGERNCSFTLALTDLGCPPVFTTVYERTTSNHLCSLRGRLLISDGIDITRVHADPRMQAVLSVASNVVWNFPYANVEEQHDHVHEELIQGAFMSMALAVRDSSNMPFSFGLALQGDQFSRWSVQRAARRTGWKLEAWCPFDAMMFSGYIPCQSNRARLPYQHARFYLFSLIHCHGNEPVKKEDECAICLIEVEEFVLLHTCQHSFCRNCLDRVVSIAAEEDSNNGHNSHRRALCPLCRVPFHPGDMQRQH